MIVFCNAKVNIGLRVLGRRSDGFHDLQSFFLPIPIRDALEIIKADHDGLRIFSSGIEIPGNGNICGKVYDLLGKEFDLPGLDLHLLKTIPVGAGLGGGSANAAAMLKLLNKTVALGISEPGLLAYAEKLGSDVPFFIKNESCLVSGRGEILEPFSIDFNDRWMQVVNPGIHCSTADIFSRHRLDSSSEDLKIALKRPINEWSDHVHNDLEAVAFERHPQIGQLKEEMYERGAQYASMSGSGSSVFGLFAERPEAFPHFNSWEFQL